MFHPIELILALLAVAVALGLLARRIGVPYEILLVVGGSLLAFQDWVPPATLEPELVFLLFLPPLLYSGAFSTHWPSFRDQLRAITLLAVGLVLFTTVCVAAVAHYWIGMDWAPAFVLGAIVSPPDAVAAIAVTQSVRVPRIITTILEGESLVNDASALVILRVAVAATAAGFFSLEDAGIQFLVVGFGGIALGIAGGWLAVAFHSWLERNKLADPKLTITVTLLTPYAVYLPAEHLHVSGVLAVVAAGLWVGNRCERIFSCELYEEARSVWEWVEFLLNSLIFILIGLALRQVMLVMDGDIHPYDLALYAGGISAAAILARLIWMFPGAYLPRLFDRHVMRAEVVFPPWQNVIVVGWTGMRGVVSIAAALALPIVMNDGKPFPHRGLIQFLTFWVIFATLIGQGLTLPLVIRTLGVSDQGDDEPDESQMTCKPRTDESPPNTDERAD